MIAATGIGSMPGASDQAYREVTKTVAGVLPQVPFVPELPGRGGYADMTARAVAIVAELGFDVQPSGWRLTDSPGIDQRRARSQLNQDLDVVEEMTQGYTGTFKTQICGPWTLAATVERPRGDRVLADHGARRELAQALAEGVRTHLADLKRRVPGADRWIVQLDEPALAAVMHAQVPTASGFSKHRGVDGPAASPALECVVEAITGSGAEAWFHACARDTDLDLLRTAGAAGVFVDMSVLSAGDLDVVATMLETGFGVGLGILGAEEPVLADGQLIERVLRWFDMLGVAPEELTGDVLLTPACGLVNRNAAEANKCLTALQSAAGQLP